MSQALQRTFVTLFACGIVGFLTLTSTSPAYAATAGTTCHHDTSIVSLRTCVQHAIQQGHITNAEVGKTLLYFVDSAHIAGHQGATIMLRIFTTIVEHESGHAIDAMHAKDLIMHAHLVMQASAEEPSLWPSSR